MEIWFCHIILSIKNIKTNAHFFFYLLYLLPVTREMKQKESIFLSSLSQNAQEPGINSLKFTQTYILKRSNTRNNRLLYVNSVLTASVCVIITTTFYNSVGYESYLQPLLYTACASLLNISQVRGWYDSRGIYVKSQKSSRALKRKYVISNDTDNCYEWLSEVT